MLRRFAVLASLAASLHAALPPRGAETPWTTYEAEEMRTTGEKLGPRYDPWQVETESSGQRCVKLSAAGQYVEFTAQAPANALVVRYSLPDAPHGGGRDASLSLYLEGRLVRKLPLTSRYTWLYGAYPFTNDPQAGQPRNFYDEARLKDLAIPQGAAVRLQWDAGEGAAWCIVDFVELEQIAPPLTAPPDSLSITDPSFGAVGDGETDATTALRTCLTAAQAEGKPAWLPAGVFKITGDIDLPSGVMLRGAGMWHTTLVGDAAQYANAARRVRLNGRGSRIHLADFAILGKLDYRNDGEPNDGLGDAFGENSTIARVWVEHTKTGVWVNNSSNLVVEGCRFRNTIADGANFCVGMRASTITNCTARGTGDDGFAFWPATHAPQQYAPGFNTLSHCTAQLPFLANGAALYGGEANRIEHCRFIDITAGSAILISTTFPTADPARKLDNNFTSITGVRGCDLIRSGGYDHTWQWRAALQICLDRRSLSGLDLRDLNITDSLSDGLSVVAPGNQHGQGTLSDATVTRLSIPNFGLGATGRHGLWIRNDASGSLAIRDSTIAELENSSTNFTIRRE
jgi:hypothetical protein